MAKSSLNVGISYSIWLIVFNIMAINGYSISIIIGWRKAKTINTAGGEISAGMQLRVTLA